jgi:quercetin dioxygenase-like cupin family protein
VTKYAWAAIPEERLSATAVRQAIHTVTMTLARLTLAKGAVVPVHSHPNEQVTTIESGTLKFTFPDREVIVTAGDMLQIPPHLPHGVETLEETVAIDLFSPPREDWIRGDDAYLRG